MRHSKYKGKNMSLFKSLVMGVGLLVNFKAYAEGYKYNQIYLTEEQKSLKNFKTNQIQPNNYQNWDMNFYEEELQEDIIRDFDCYINYNDSEICFSSPDNYAQG